MCNCILCFLDEINHFKWRAEAQKEGQSNLQHVRNYHKILLEKIDSIAPISDCPYHNQVHGEMAQFWNEKYKEIPLKVLVSDFLNEIELIYEKWNNGYVVEATQLMESIITFLRKENISASIPHILFRNRIERPDEKIIDKNELWHIPFYKRSLVKNYRYSISGRPMLYLGSSVYDVVQETRPSDELKKPMSSEQKERNKLSLFVLNKSKLGNGQKLKIFDLTNPFTRLNLAMNVLANSNVNINGRLFNDDLEMIGYKVRTFMLMSCCSFPTTNSDSCFYEEYVISQLLTEVLYKRGFSAIKYSSVRINPGLLKNPKYDIWHNNCLRENYIFFTKYSEFHEHDSELKKIFRNTIPQSYASLLCKTGCNDEQWLDNLQTKMVKMGMINDGNVTDDNIIAYNFNRRNVFVDGKHYWDTEYGKCEMNMLKQAEEEGLFY